MGRGDCGGLRAPHASVTGPSAGPLALQPPERSARAERHRSRNTSTPDTSDIPDTPPRLSNTCYYYFFESSALGSKVRVSDSHPHQTHNSGHLTEFRRRPHHVGRQAGSLTSSRTLSTPSRSSLLVFPIKFSPCRHHENEWLHHPLARPMAIRRTSLRIGRRMPTTAASKHHNCCRL